MSEAEELRSQNKQTVIWAANATPEAVADHIARIIKQPGARSLVVPGGNTPLAIFDLLSRQSLPWGTVSLMLSDDRIVEQNHAASNYGKLASAFDATAATLVLPELGMSIEQTDLVWLGMGADGHIASLFPMMESSETAGMKAQAPAVIRTVPDPLPPEAPFARLSLNMAALTNTKEIILVVRGCDKKQILEDAIEGRDDLPVAQLIKAARCPITIYWSRT